MLISQISIVIRLLIYLLIITQMPSPQKNTTFLEPTTKKALLIVFTMTMFFIVLIFWILRCSRPEKEETRPGNTVEQHPPYPPANRVPPIETVQSARDAYRCHSCNSHMTSRSMVGCDLEVPPPAYHEGNFRDSGYG